MQLMENFRWIADFVEIFLIFYLKPYWTIKLKVNLQFESTLHICYTWKLPHFSFIDSIHVSIVFPAIKSVFCRRSIAWTWKLNPSNWLFIWNVRDSILMCHKLSTLIMSDKFVMRIFGNLTDKRNLIIKNKLIILSQVDRFFLIRVFVWEFYSVIDIIVYVWRIWVWGNFAWIWIYDLIDLNGSN